MNYLCSNMIIVKYVLRVISVVAPVIVELYILYYKLMKSNDISIKKYLSDHIQSLEIMANYITENYYDHRVRRTVYAVVLLTPTVILSLSVIVLLISILSIYTGFVWS